MKQLVVGIDIGGTNSVYGLVDRDGNMYGEGVVPTRKYPDFDQYLEELYIGIQNLLKQLDTDYELTGIGIGAPNANYYNGTIENAANLVWQGVIPFVEKMKRYYPTIPILITNDANAAAIGEGVYGAARGMKDYIVVTLGTGLGSGFVANGELVAQIASPANSDTLLLTTQNQGVNAVAVEADASKHTSQLLV